MNRLAAIALLTLLATTASAQQVEPPTEEQKVEALKEAYRRNGNSMVGPMIDLTIQEPKKVFTERIAPDAPEDKNEQPDLNMNDLRKFARRANMKTDICARHHMRKVVKGDSWRCRK